MFLLNAAYRSLHGIYYIYNTVVCKMYIGKCSDSKGLQTRLSHHHNALKRGNHFNPTLQEDCNKYGINSFKFGVLQLCDREDTLLFEQEWLSKALIFRDKYYNNTFIAEGQIYVTDETRKRLSEAHTGKTYTEETKKRISKSQRGKWRKDSRTGYPNVKFNHGKYRFTLNRYDKHWECGGYDTPEEAYKDCQYCLTLSDEDLTKWIEEKRAIRIAKQSSKYKGVSFCKYKQKYNAYFNHNGKRKSLGYHETEDLAYQRILEYKQSIGIA